jgi:hypothetical protein
VAQVPRIVWKTGPTPAAELSADVLEELQRIHSQNYAVVYLDNRDAEAFLTHAFHPDVLAAFRALVPGAFKADLLRYCLMYRYGGVYSDLHQVIDVPMDTLLKQGNPLFVRDVNEPDVQISLMASSPRRECFGRAIARIVLNVQHRRYGDNFLDMTGPCMFGKLVPALPPTSLTQTDHWNICIPDGARVVQCHALTCNFTSGAYSTLWADRKAVEDTSDHMYANWDTDEGVCPLRGSVEGPWVCKQEVARVLEANRIPVTQSNFPSRMSLYDHVKQIGAPPPRIMKGAAAPNVAVMMLCYNNGAYCRQTLPALMRNVQAVLKKRNLAPSFYFYDNSSDDTGSVLTGLEGDVCVVSEPFPLPTPPASGDRSSARCNRIAACRNALIGMARPTLLKSQFAILIDSNVYADTTALSRLVEFKMSSEQVGMATACTMSSTSLMHYYDTYAYCPLDATSAWKFVACPMKHCRRKECAGAQRTMELNDAPCRVKSAFGGLAVVDAAALLQGHWESHKNQCEHVAFCQQLRSRGLDVYVVPRARAQWCHVYRGHAQLVGPMQGPTRRSKGGKIAQHSMRRVGH